jgi:lambda family phage portal protein
MESLMLETLLSRFRSNPLSSTSQVPIVTNRAASYEAGSVGTRRTVDWDVPDATANSATQTAPTIRTRCRDAMRNDSWARAIVETLTDDVIGWGVKPLFRAPNEAYRQCIQALWEEWSEYADADGLLDFNGLQALAFRTMVVDGESFIRLRKRLKEDNLAVPLQLQVLPPEICPEAFSLPSSTSGNVIKQGIQFSPIGKRVAFHLRDVVPGEEDINTSSGLTHAVPATEVLHLFEPIRPGQRRGVSMMAPALPRLRELDKYADATLLRLQLSSMFVATLKKTPGEGLIDPLNGLSIRDTEDQRPILQMKPGTFQELTQDEILDFNKPPDPPVGFPDFVKHELRAAGAAIGVPLEAFTHDWGATNDRLARVVLNQYRRRMHRLLWSIAVPQLLRPVWNAWFQVAILTNPSLLAGADGDDRKNHVTFAPHAHAYVHPVQDVQSYREAVRSGLTSRAAAVAETGEDVEVIDAQNAADNTRADALKLQYDSDGRRPA